MINFNISLLLVNLFVLGNSIYDGATYAKKERACFVKVLDTVDKDYLCKEYFKEPVDFHGNCALNYDKLNMYVDYHKRKCMLE